MSITSDIEESEPQDEPRLIVLIVVDQMRGSYLERYAPVLEGGLKWLQDHGVSFSQAYHGHALTITSPGHASLSTGSYPRRHGVIANDWYSRADGGPVYAAQDSDGIRSPRRLEASTLGDWLKERSSASKVLSASTKDRSAIFLGGHRADAAFWSDHKQKGGFVTSSYYSDYFGNSFPAWVEAFNAENGLDHLFGKLHAPTPMSPEMLRRLGIEDFDAGPLIPMMPRALGSASGSPNSLFYKDLQRSQHGVTHLTRFARRMIVEEELGADRWTDLLTLSYSELDAVGHNYGPQSHEHLEVILELDRQLGELFEHLDSLIGLDHVVIALSGDHGVMDVPEVRQAHGLPARRVGSDEILCFQRLHWVLAERYGEGDWFEEDLLFQYLNLDLIEQRGVSRSEIERVSAEYLAKCPSVVRVWTRQELSGESPPEGGDSPAGESPASRSYAEAYYRSFHVEHSPDMLVQMDEQYLFDPTNLASHSSPYSYDTHVPFIVVAPSCAAAKRDSTPVFAVDLAPTLAHLADVKPPPEIDGVDRGALICPPAAN